MTESDKLTELLKANREEAEEANAKLLHEQRGITWGSYFIRGNVESGYFEFGQVLSEEQIRTGEIELGASEGEADYILDRKRQTHSQGYRWSRVFSSGEPRGDLTYLHCIGLWPITKEDFEIAQKREWEPHPTMLLRINTEMQEAADREGIEL